METPAPGPAHQSPAHTLPERLTWGSVTLSVTDLDRAFGFWTHVVGLVLRSRTARGVTLGTPERTLLVLEEGASTPVARGVAGMYHIALAMPSQPEFSRRIARFIQLGQGFSAVDHLMSKALYLKDPDGHGIEIAWETPGRFGRFAASDEGFAMIDSTGRPHSGRAPLSLRSELAQGQAVNPALPLLPGACVGHLHLHVPSLDGALRFFEGVGFIRNLLLPRMGMADMGTGGRYSHRLAVNLWAGPEAVPAPAASARLLRYRLRTSDPAVFAAARTRLSPDPATGSLIGTDPAGVTVQLDLTGADIAIGASS